MMTTNVAIVVLNWNGKQYLKDCLDSLATQTTKALVILVDNGSTDSSVPWVKEHYPWVQLIPLAENTGFAYANNVGIQEAFKNPAVEYVITLNNDTRVDAHYVEEMVAAATRHPDAASIQAKVVRFNQEKILDCTGILIFWDLSAMNRGQDEPDNGQYEQEEEIFGASASAALYTRQALEQVKLPNGDYFDRDYFAYYEDVDLAWRLRFLGFTSWYTPRAQVHHIHSATGKRHSPFKAFHIHRNQYYNIVKNLPVDFLLVAILFMPIRYGLLVSSVLRRRGPSAELRKNASEGKMVNIVLRSWKDLLVSLPSLYRKRRHIQRQRQVRLREVAGWFHKWPASLSKMIYG